MSFLPLISAITNNIHLQEEEEGQEGGVNSGIITYINTTQNIYTVEAICKQQYKLTNRKKIMLFAAGVVGEEGKGMSCL